MSKITKQVSLVYSRIIIDKLKFKSEKIEVLINFVAPRLIIITKAC